MNILEDYENTGSGFKIKVTNQYFINWSIFLIKKILEWEVTGSSFLKKVRSFC